jgi:hypothetical protein
MARSRCSNCGIEYRVGQGFCGACGGALPPATPTARSGWRRRAPVLAAALVIAVGLGALIHNGGAASGDNLVTAPEIQPFLPQTRVIPRATEEAICPNNMPDWNEVLVTPASFRGRCVYVVGFLASGPTAQNPGIVRMALDHARLQAFAISDAARAYAVGTADVSEAWYGDFAQQDQALWVIFNSAGPPPWQPADSTIPFAVLGTIQGTRDGLPYINAQQVGYARTYDTSGQ